MCFFVEMHLYLNEHILLFYENDNNFSGEVKKCTCFKIIKNIANIHCILIILEFYKLVLCNLTTIINIKYIVNLLGYDRTHEILLYLFCNY